MVVSCVIEFDQNPHGTYFAGQTLSGKITLQSDKVKQVKGVALKIKGFAHAQWSEGTSRGKNRSSRRRNYRGHEDYLASITYLLGSEENKNMVNIEPGVHSYYFACQIPPFCPSSFEGFYGHVRYTVKVVLMRPWKFDQSFTHGFTVLQVADLNNESPILRLPAASEISKTFCCGPCSSKPLNLNVNLAQTGFVPGQKMHITVLITNESSIQVEEVWPALIMLVCYRSQSPRAHSKIERTVVTKLKGEPVPRNCNKLFHYELSVPATPPTSLNLSRIIQVSYQLEVEAKLKFGYANQVVCTPVTIGNAPLGSVVQQQPKTGTITGVYGDSAMIGKIEERERVEKDMNMKADDVATTSANINDIYESPITQEAALTPTSPWGGDSNIAPPSYEEALHMHRGKINEDEEHDYGQKDFAPRYPVFNIHLPTAPQQDECDGDVVDGSNEPKNTTWL